MENQNIRITLNVSEEQMDTINHLFNHYGWNYDEISRAYNNGSASSSAENSQDRNDVACQTAPQNLPLDDNDDNGYQEYNIPQSPDEEECRFCLCRSCITNEQNRQFWWEDNNEAPCRRNSALRKEKYKRFWTMMFHRDAWKDPRYQAEKLRALRADPRHRKYEWHRHDIMPKCVLSLVRQWFPNPAGVPYMGHLWE